MEVVCFNMTAASDRLLLTQDICFAENVAYVTSSAVW
jgi:hypothetical protein